MSDPSIRKNSFTRSNIGTTQDKILYHIQSFIDDNGYPPSVREICEGTGIRSTSTVHAHLKRLTETGRLNYDSGRRRAISINSEEHSEHNDPGSERILNIPLVGTVAAGVPILAEQNIETTLPFPADFIRGSEDVFALKVRGDSMTDAAILDGDYVIVRKQHSAHPEDIVVAMIDDEATVKTFKSINGVPFLKPENPKYDLIPFYNENSSIIGKVIGVFRNSI